MHTFTSERLGTVEGGSGIPTAVSDPGKRGSRQLAFSMTIYLWFSRILPTLCLSVDFPTPFFSPLRIDGRMVNARLHSLMRGFRTLSVDKRIQKPPPDPTIWRHCIADTRVRSSPPPNSFATLTLFTHRREQLIASLRLRGGGGGTGTQSPPPRLSPYQTSLDSGWSTLYHIFGIPTSRKVIIRLRISSEHVPRSSSAVGLQPGSFF